MPKYGWLLYIVMLSSLWGCLLTRRGRFTSELSFMHCLCGTSVYYRMQRLQCMEQYVPPDNMYRMSQSVQYCGYFANKTNFGQTVRQRIYVPNYNPWEPSPDFHTEMICNSYTRIRPGNVAAPNIWYVTNRGWVISKCILNMARIDYRRASHMIQICC